MHKMFPRPMELSGRTPRNNADTNKTQQSYTGATIMRIRQHQTTFSS